MTQDIIMQAVQETCQVVTSFGTRKDMKFLDCDNFYAMFKDNGNVVIINLEDIKSLEYKDEESKDRKHIRNKDTNRIIRETDQ